MGTRLHVYVEQHPLDNPMALKDRTHALVEHVVERMRSAPVRDLEVAYVMYGLRVC